MPSLNVVLSICICLLTCAMMFAPNTVADVVATIRDISQNSARYRALSAQIITLEKRLMAAEAATSNCSKNIAIPQSYPDTVLADIASDIETLLRRQNEVISSVNKHLKSHDDRIDQVNGTAFLLWNDINVLRNVINDAAAEFKTTQRLIEAFEKNAARSKTEAAASNEKRNVAPRDSSSLGPQEPLAFDNMVAEQDENEEEEDDATTLTYGVGARLNPDGSTPVILRPKDSPRVVFELHEEGFEKAMQEGHQLVVMFYAPWCPHCKSAMGPFEIAGGQSEVGFARLNGDEFPELMQRHAIPGFPTIRKYHKGKMIEEYRGDRGVDSFIAFGMDRTKS